MKAMTPVFEAELTEPIGHAVEDFAVQSRYEIVPVSEARVVPDASIRSPSLRLLPFGKCWSSSLPLVTRMLGLPLSLKITPPAPTTTGHLAKAVG